MGMLSAERKYIYPQKPPTEAEQARCYGDDVRDAAEAAGKIGAYTYGPTDLKLIESWQERKAKKARAINPAAEIDPALKRKEQKREYERDKQRERRVRVKAGKAPPKKRRDRKAYMADYHARKSGRASIY